MASHTFMIHTVKRNVQIYSGKSVIVDGMLDGKKVVAYVKMKPSIFYLGAQKPLMSRRSMQGAEKCTNFG